MLLEAGARADAANRTGSELAGYRFGQGVSLLADRQLDSPVLHHAGVRHGHRHGGPGRPVDAAPVWREIFWGEEGLGTFQCCT